MVDTPRHVALLSLPPKLTLEHAREVYEEFARLAASPERLCVEVDFGRVVETSSAGLIAVAVGCRALRQAGKTCTRTHVTAEHRAALELLPEVEPASEPTSRSLEQTFAPGAVRRLLGRNTSKLWSTLLELAEVVVDTTTAIGTGLRCLIRGKRRRSSAVLEQAVIIGVDAFVIVGLLSMLIGIILAYQAAYQLRQFGAEVFMAEVVSLGMVREFGGMMTAIILAGRSGAAMAAELGTMAIREETDALRTMGISPVRFLVLPRVLAITLIQPALTLMAMALGMLGGIVIAGSLGLSSAIVFQRMQEALGPSDFALGLVKSVLFAWIIGFTGCFMGLRTRGGAHSVGRNTTRAVVASIFAIVLTDSAVTTVWTASDA
jgi:phospholipid/cholesterol/gamma-HCH transport system permease protein